MNWVRLDVGFPRNHKILGLIEDENWRAIAVYVCGLAYAGEQGTDGYLPRGVLPFLHGTKAEADALLVARLWLPDKGGWQINDWDEFQPSTAEMRARSERARAASLARWGANGNA